MNSLYSTKIKQVHVLSAVLRGENKNAQVMEDGKKTVFKKNVQHQHGARMRYPVWLMIDGL